MYSRVDSACKRATELAIIEGEPGQVFQLSHRITGMVIGEVKVKVGKLSIWWAWQ